MKFVQINANAGDVRNVGPMRYYAEDEVAEAVRLAVVEEREACAKMAEWVDMAEDLAERIRARSQ